jgi:hypothetical protein
MGIAIIGIALALALRPSAAESRFQVPDSRQPPGIALGTALPVEPLTSLSSVACRVLSQSPRSQSTYTLHTHYFPSEP